MYVAYTDPYLNWAYRMLKSRGCKSGVIILVKKVNLTTVYMIFFFSSSEIPKLNQRLAKSQRENECLQEKVKRLTLVADTVELKTQQLQTSLQQGNELQSRCHELQKETLGKRILTFEANFQVK